MNAQQGHGQFVAREPNVPGGEPGALDQWKELTAPRNRSSGPAFRPAGCEAGSFDAFGL